MASATEFVVRPNASFNIRSSRWIFALLAVICLTIGIRFALMGFWLILPFAIIDVIALGLILLIVMRRYAYIEKIRITDDVLTIRHVEKKNRCSWQFPLHWVRVELSAQKHPWYARRLLVGSKGEWIEIGQCLTEPERLSLAGAIRESIQHRLDPEICNTVCD